MTAPGLLTSHTLEVELTAGVWTDISPYVRADSPVSMVKVRNAVDGPATPGTFAVTLDNSDGRFTPGNALGPYLPGWAEGVRLRYKVTKGSTFTRFIGAVVSIEPEFPTTAPGQGIVNVGAIDALANLGLYKLRTDYVEASLWDAFNAGNTAEIYMLDEPTGSDTLKNSDPNGPPLLIYSPKGSPSTGVLTMAAAEGLPGGGLMHLEPHGVGRWISIAVCQPRTTSVPTSARLTFAFRTEKLPSAAYGDIVNVFTPDNNFQFRLRVQSTGALDCYDSTGTPTNLVPASGIIDNDWHTVTLIGGAGGVTASILLDQFKPEGFPVSATLSPCKIVGASTVIFGANCFPWALGKQTNGFDGDIAAISIVGAASAADFNGPSYLHPSIAVKSASSRLTDYDRAARTRGLPAMTTTGTAEVMNVSQSNHAGMSLLDALDELRRTTGAELIWDPVADAPRWYRGDALRPGTVAATIDSEVDLDHDGGYAWRLATDTVPTRVTVDWPSGSVTVVRTESEVGGRSREQSITTCAADEAGARAVAGSLLSRSRDLRPTSLRINLPTAGNDLYTAIMGIEPGERIRVSNVPASIFGRSYVDCYVLGWTEEYSELSASFTFNFDAADSPVASRFGDAETGRFAQTSGASTVTSGTAVGTTANGTIIVTTTGAGTPWTVSAGAYAMDCDWNGERVTITSAPASSTSPQTMTTTARGVAPTVARSHSAGEVINVWHGGAIA